MKFLENVLATIVGLFIFCVVGFFFVLIIGVIMGSGSSETVKVKENSVVELDLSSITHDYGGKYSDPWVEMFSEASSVGVSDVIRAIEAAKKDEKIKGISILNNNSDLGIAQTKAVRDALADFKKTGKFIVSYADVYSQKEYYLNSVADTLYLNPAGDLDFKGLSTELMFFKDFQDKTGIKMEVIRHGKYKSAVEPFLDNKMSDANREQLTTLLNSVWSSVVEDIAASRKLPVTKLNAIANGLLARTPEMALREGLVDKLGYEDQYHNGIRKALKVDRDKEYNKVSISDYAKKVATTALSGMGDDKIAVIYAQGEIKSGEGDVDYIGEGSMRRALKAARLNKNVKAIVLRIDSPGGDAMTSELIWREIEITKKVKPVVVSMGNYAASGGYYIACNANKIFAEKNTVTGSIGVFGVLPNFTELANKAGVHTEVVSTHANSANYSPFRPLGDEMRARTLESVERVYGTFLTRVAEGRHMNRVAVDSIGQGRVWSGADALKIGLVDQIGGMDAALKEAAKLGKMKEYSVVNYPEYDKKFGDLLAGKLPFAKTKESLIKEEVGPEAYLVLEQLRSANTRKGVQALLPFGMDIR